MSTYWAESRITKWLCLHTRSLSILKSYSLSLPQWKDQTKSKREKKENVSFHLFLFIQSKFIQERPREQDRIRQKDKEREKKVKTTKCKTCFFNVCWVALKVQYKTTKTNHTSRIKSPWRQRHPKRGYHWAIYAPAAFLRTKSGLSLYGAPSMGSETTPPYAWLLWRFKKTLANPVTWCCRCLYDMLARKLQVCSATTSERLLSAFLLSIMRLKCDLQNKYTQTNKSKRQKKREREREKEKSRTY